MTVTMRAHFDGKAIIPDEPVTLPEGTPLVVSVETAVDRLFREFDLDKQTAAYEAFLERARARPVPHLSDEAIRRENMYED